MKIAYTQAPGRGDTDLLLARVADILGERGVRACGTVQINSKREDCCRCDMDVLVLPEGPIIRISQSLGRDALGCRLDPHALETAVGLVGASLEAGADVLIVNKFGKHEAEGRGFRGLIGEAVALEIPVLVGLNSLSEDAFHEFTGGVAIELAPVLEDLLGWFEAQKGNRRNAA